MNVNIMLYDDFDAMSALGIGQLFETLPNHFDVLYLSERSGLIEGPGNLKVWTEYLIPEEVEGIFLIPSGRGVRRLLATEPDALQSITESAKNADYCMMIGNASGLLAQTGLLFRRMVVDYPEDVDWKTSHTAGMKRIGGVGWLADGKYYSSTDAFSGISMACSVIAEVTEERMALEAAARLGFSWDPAEGLA